MWDNCWIALASGSGSRGGGGRPEDSVGTVGGGTGAGEEFRGELLREEAGQAGLK